MDIVVNLLGPLEVASSGAAVQFDGAKQRTVFTALALKAPEPVAVDVLIETLWGDDPPGGAVRALQKQVSRLRQRLGADAPLHHRPAGYVLEIDRAAVDAHRFEELLRAGRAALDAEHPQAARDDLEAALALWRGPALADHRFETFAQFEIARLEELRLEAVEERMAAELACGRDADLIGELQALVAEHPLRERLRAHLMLALYRGGRQAEALETMREGRRMLVDELGIEPGPELRRLERMILAHDPELTAERPSPHATSLPVPPARTIGREGELAELAALVTRPDVRLLTLVGPGGVGKTLLALEAARAVEERFPGGAARVNLDGADRGSVLAAEAASALGLVAASAAELGEQLQRSTRGAPALLVIDSLERFLDDAGELAELLAAAPNVTVLATSRAALRLSGEHVYALHPLAPPNATELFAARAEAALAGFELDDANRALVQEICARLDGLPLALELAADRVRLLPLPALLARLEHRLELLTEGPRDLPARQRSLRATLEWSWEVLDEPERRLLCRLTVFEGGASLSAAEEVCNADGAIGARIDDAIAGLLDKTSLLRADAHGDEPRFGMLETIREFAAERVADHADVAELELRHGRHFLRFSEAAARESARAHRRESLDRLAHERANLRLAHERLLRAGHPDEALRVAIAFASALPWDAHTQEVRVWLDEALTELGDEQPALEAAGRYWDGTLALAQGRFADADPALWAALDAARVAGDGAMEAAVLTAIGRCAILVGSDRAHELCSDAVAAARASRDPKAFADALMGMAGACERGSAWPEAAGWAEKALEVYRAIPDPYGVATALGELGWYDIVNGTGERAEGYLAEALELRRRHGDDRRLVEPLVDAAWLALTRGLGGEARGRFLDCLSLALHVDDRFNAGEALAGLAALAGREGRWVDCARLAGASAAVHDAMGAPPWESVSALLGHETAAARAALGDRFDDAFAEGLRLPADGLVRTAMAWAEPIVPVTASGLPDLR